MKQQTKNNEGLKMFQVFTVYKSFPESYCEVSSEEEAKETVAELRRDRNLDDAFYEEIK